MAIDTRYGSAQTRGNADQFSEPLGGKLPFERALCYEYINEIGRGHTLGTIIGYPIGANAELEATTYLPFFQTHIMLPVKPGEEVWTFSDGFNNYWMTRIVGQYSAEDVNFTHVDREFIEPNQNVPTAKEKLEKKPYIPLFNNGSSPQQTTKPDNFKDFINVNKIAAVPRNQPALGDLLLQSSHDATIKLGTEFGFIGGELSESPSSVIDLHVGKVNKGSTIVNELGIEELNKVSKITGSEDDTTEGIPEYFGDTSRIYITENSPLDNMFGITPVENLFKENIGMDSGAGIALKAPHIKSKAQKIDLIGTSGGIIIDNDIQVYGDIIYLGVKNTDGDEPLVGTHEVALEGMHPYVRWGFLKDYLEELNAILAEFAGTCEANKSPGYMSPNLELTQASITMKTKLDQLVQKFDPIPSARIYGE